MADLVCPECGHDEFKQTRTCRVEFTVMVSEFGFEDTSQSMQDAGEQDEDGLTCDDCGQAYDYDTSRLITEEEYNEREGYTP